MGLRARLALFFVVITVIPLAVALVALQVQVSQQLARRASASLALLERAAASQLELVRERAGDLATDLAGPPSAMVLAEGDRDAAQAWLEEAVADVVGTRADFVVLAEPDGELLAAVVSPPAAEDPGAFPDPERLAAAAAERAEPPRALLEVREVRGRGPAEPERVLGYVVTGTWMDRDLLETLAVTAGAALAVAGEVVAAVGAPVAALEDVRLPALSSGETVVEIDGSPQLLGSLGVDGLDGALPDTALLLWTPVTRPDAPVRLALLLLVPVLLAGAIGWLLAGTVVQPVRRAADVARAVAEGDLQQSLEPSGGRELRDLAVALNAMTSELAARLDELERSRSELRRSLSRLGETLSSSLDLNRTLAVVVETAMETLAAERGLLMLFTPERDALYLKVGRGVGSDVPRLALGEGLLGTVAQSGASFRLPADAEDAPAPAVGEPTAAYQLAVPMLGRGRVMGVLSLFRDADDLPFSQDDLDTVRSFAAQASVAIENVMLHQEAQRLSVTDALTGLWNFRYFQLQADREMESATRFARPLSLAIVDIDHFKEVNDRHGHQVGDDVLIEVAQRLRVSTRVPDVVARYGGEEFVVLLPNTGVDGALATAERIREAVSGAPIAYGHRAGLAAGQLEITCSVGVATFPDHGRTMAALLRSADAAMYGAKTAGRNRVVGAGSGSSAQSS